MGQYLRLLHNYGSEGRGFESSRAREEETPQKEPKTAILGRFFVWGNSVTLATFCSVFNGIENGPCEIVTLEAFGIGKVTHRRGRKK